MNSPESRNPIPFSNSGEIMLNHGTLDTSLQYAAYRLDDIVNLLGFTQGAGNGTWKLVNGLTVLDLGCGSISSPDRSSFDSPFTVLNMSYKPYLCRLLGQNGAKAYGIDLGEGDKEDEATYTHIQTNIVDQVLTNGLAQIPQLRDIQFDIIHSYCFLGGSPSPVLENCLSVRRLEGSDFNMLLINQATPMLKNKGLLLLDNNYYRKEESRLVKLFE